MRVALCEPKESPACLQQLYACGEYDTIIATLGPEKGALSADHAYFMGAAFFGRQIRDRATAGRCESARSARLYLTDYLTSLDRRFGEEGTFGSAQHLDQIYHATQMLDALDTLKGCPEPPLGQAEVEILARATATDYATEVFLDPPEEMSDAFATLQGELRGMVSQASELETGTALRQVEIASARSNLDDIRKLFAAIFGEVTGSGPATTTGTEKLEALAKRTDRQVKKVAEQEKRFADELECTPEEFAALREKTVEAAFDFLEQSAAHLQMVEALRLLDRGSSFASLVRRLQEEPPETPAENVRAALENITAAWAEYGTDKKSGICSAPKPGRVWYCR